MTRDELLGKLAEGRKYLERTDITSEQRERAQARYDELRAELRKMDEPPPRVEDPREAERAAEAIATIRNMLGMKK